MGRGGRGKVEPRRGGREGGTGEGEAGVCTTVVEILVMQCLELEG